MKHGFICALLLGAPSLLAAQSIELTPARTHATVGDTVTFKVVVRDSAGSVIDTARVTWSAAPFDVAWALQDGRIVPVRQGEVQVLALARGRVARATLTVGPKPPATLQLESAQPNVVPGELLPLRATARNSDGENLREARISYRSSDDRIATVDAAGVVHARAAGSVTIHAEAGAARATHTVRVVPNDVARLQITGDHAARTGDVVRFQAAAFDARGGAVSAPVRWSVSGAGAEIHPDGGFVAERPGSYVVSASVGNVTSSVSIAAAARVHTRKLERLHTRVMRDVPAAEHWAIGNALYVSTLGDRVYTFDIREPGNPVLVDSVRVDARVINDVQTSADGRIGVLTREGASSRRNGIVFLDLADPLRPKVLSEYTSTVSGGVHSVFIDGQHVYLTDDATGSLRVIDFSDVKQPKEVARWEVPGVVGIGGVKDAGSGDVVGGSVGRMLHDLQVVNGLVYLAYWRHGIVILDVGNGIKGGSPASPKLVSQYTYNVADLYPADRIAGTHTVFRYKNYLFVGDEVFPPQFNIQDPARIETAGQVHVLDVTDIEKPRKVADYYVAGGAHNVWVEDDVLYIGAYEAGLRALDVSGELRGDLIAQGREIGALWTGDPKGFRPNLPMAWGAQPHRGVIFVTDMNSGLWVARLTPKIAF